MRKGIFILLCVVFVQVAMPSLCAAGILTHNCDCPDDDRCHHESDCDSDPCGLTLARQAEGIDCSLSPAPLVLILVNNISAEYGSVRLRDWATFTSATIHARKRSYQASGLPLQI